MTPSEEHIPGKQGAHLAADVVLAHSDDYAQRKFRNIFSTVGASQ